MNSPQSDAMLTLPVTPARDHIRGNASAPVTLVEYGDYECPYCRMAHGIVTSIQAQLQDRVRFVFRHFPLTTVHPHAQPAAEAAEAAATQRKFWPMHDRLFTAQAPLTDDVFVANARALGLDIRSFATEVTGHVHLPRIREDFMSGVHSGVNGTPAFYINGIRHDGNWDFPTLYTALSQVAGPTLHLSGR